MKLLGLVYVSNSKILFDDPLLKSLALEYDKKNKDYDITGYLYFDKDTFIQYIEGTYTDVEQLFTNIKKDNRHNIINVLKNNELAMRKFPNWHMRWLNKNMLSQINIEFIIADYLIFSSSTNNVTLKKETVWRMVDKLSTFRNKL